MAASGYSASVASLPPPCPKSPPEYPDLYGKRRELAKVQILEREIGFLEEELKSLERLQPASRYCKEVDSFVAANSDPLITINRKIRRSKRFWKWLCGKSCFNFSWICCSCGCSLRLQMPSCCTCCCACPQLQNWCCCCWPHCSCVKRISCKQCCILPSLSCPSCPPSCPKCLCRCTWSWPRWSWPTCSWPRCSKVCLCPDCTKTCCNPCYLCY